MIFRSVSTCFIPAAAIGTAHAASQNGTFRDWNAALDEVNTGEDVRKICTAATAANDAAGRAWTLKVAIRNGDALPPNAYPAIVVGFAGGGLPHGDNQPAVFGFGSQNVDARRSRAAAGDSEQCEGWLDAGSGASHQAWRLAVACGLHSPL
jgi:hypothetical protein